MNLVLVRATEIEPGGKVVLRDRRHEHLARVLRVTPGKLLKVGVVRGPEGIGTVVECGEDSVTIHLALGTPRPPPDFDLILAWPRPKALSRAVRVAASWGLTRIDLLRTWTVDRSYQHSHRLSLEALERDAWLGCEQGRQTYLPEIAVHERFLPFVEEVLRPRLAQESGRQLVVADPRAKAGLEDVYSLQSTGPLSLAIGSDRGFIERELVSFECLGAKLVSLGDAILTTEAAIASLLGQLQLLRRLRGRHDGP